MRRGGSVLFVLLVVAGIASCAQEEYPAWLWDEQHAAPEGGTPIVSGESATSKGPLVCVQAQAQPMPARLVAMSANAVSGGTIVLASDIFQQFINVCGGCHGPAVDPPGQGGFQIVQATDFATAMKGSVIQHVTNSVCPNPEVSTNPNDPMPPCSSPNGGTYAQRPETDPVKQSAEIVLQWLAAGSPASFTPTTSGGSTDGGSAPSAFVLTPANGNEMTNIGNCIPSAALLELASQNEKAKALDAKFATFKVQSGGSAAEAIGLPEQLSDTDLFTLDSATLAQYGVVGYAPGYPLWSDNAYKLRHVRVPIGTSIHFEKATQTFQIPPNTRFYKTFTKQIIDTDGSYRYRKIETRLIVSRPDQNNADGSVTQTALFGSYMWNADESAATLVETPLRSGEPFADTLLLYNTDEQLAAQVLSEQPADPELQLVATHAARHYAIPSSQRCVECHMGSPSQSFVLGFTPLQINRFPTGTHGVIPDFNGGSAEPDELSQLQRFIDAGIITGIDSPSDVLPLEQSQGSRTPRNEYELTAQGYVLGNCAHCHNPRGFPSVQNPVLVNVFDLLPSTGPIGGLFQFPLERYSPRIGRGLSGSTPIPYITPSLVDLPKDDPNNLGQQLGDWFVEGTAGNVAWVDYAPWRSIMYRNIDAPFAYTDDVAIFPHMPMNTPGFDMRARQILGDWMVSIPAIRKHPEIPEYAYRTDNNTTDNINGPVVDTSQQPYVEVLPGSAGYEAAAQAAGLRLSVFHTGINPAVTLAPIIGVVYSRYSDPLETEDILDPAILADPVCHPIPTNPTDQDTNPLPLHPDWVNTDLTLPPPPYEPRQPNWPNVLVEQKIPPPNTACSTPSSQAAAYADQVTAVGMLPSVALDQVEPFVNTPVPFGLWQQQAGCTFPASVPTVQQFTATSVPPRPHWMDVTNPPPNAPVYMETPGAAIFKMICINCHGPNADANGRLAQNLATMTGGDALVADFRDGLFGPPGAPQGQGNLDSVFGVAELPTPTPPSWLNAPDGTLLGDDDRAARYMAWMGLGGTAVNIPVQLLEIVAVTNVLGQTRTLAATSLSANMLSEAKALCKSLLGPTTAGGSAAFPLAVIGGQGYLDPALSRLNSTLITSNGDAELWLRLCSLANPPPIHVFPLVPNGELGVGASVPSILDVNFNFTVVSGTMVSADIYPSGVPIGNDRGGVDPSFSTANDQPNLWPWCVNDTGATPAQEAWLHSNMLPICPPSVDGNIANCNSNPGQYGPCFLTDQGNAWAVRGAINAGLSVFLYVQSIEGPGPAPDYNQCSLLQ